MSFIIFNFSFKISFVSFFFQTTLSIGSISSLKYLKKIVKEIAITIEDKNIWTTVFFFIYCKFALSKA